MNLTIDIGNTRAKLTIFDGKSPIYEEILSGDLEEAIQRMSSLYPLEKCAWCNVGEKDDEIAQIMSSLPYPTIHLTGTTEVPINVCYKSRITLGADRLAAVLGARTLKPRTDLLVIDAGTCITYDFIDAKGNYWGGNISLGLQMRFTALHDFTARLPKVEAEGPLPSIGIDTETAIRCGVAKGIVYEIEGYIADMRKEHPNIGVFITGGNKLNLSTSLKEIIYSDRYLVSRGLNSLL